MLISRIECLMSLSFPNMDQRENLVEGAANNTCTWLLGHEEYENWRGRRHALLWIVGKPGAGKSTLMRYALRRASHSSDVVASFFFFSRGSDLQKSPCGLFRSLLHQLLDQIPEMLSDFIPIYEKKSKTKQESNSDIQWHETELREYLEQWILSASRNRPIRIYVDALDEAGKGLAEKLIEYFEDLIERLDHTRAGFAVCFSCRHYPVLVPKNVRKIYVEKENSRDIATYVRQRLTKYQLADPAEAQELEQEIIAKASRIFQWVVLIIPIIIEADKNGASVRKIRQKIKEIPGELGDLYRHILSKIEDQKRAAQLMQWVCFARRPLSLAELRYAMVVDLTNDFTSHEECRGSKDFAETDEQMKRTVNSLFGGLAETVEYGDQQTVRVIHQSVNDYLSNGGLQDFKSLFFDDINQYLSKSGLPSLDASLADNLVGLADFRISRSCVKYVIFEEVREEWKIIARSYGLRARLVYSRFPLLEYSRYNWISHAQRVETQRIPQADLLSLCRWPSRHALPSPRPIELPYQSPEAHNLLEIASENGLLSVLEAMIESAKSLDLNSKRDDIEPRWDGHRALLLAALEGQVAVVQFLIKQDHFQIDLKHYEFGGSTALGIAASKGREAVVQSLIQQGAEIESKDEYGQTPLSQAAEIGSEAVVQLLIQQGAKIESKDEYGQTPLSQAAARGHEAVVRLLIQQGAKIESKDKYGRTPLSQAARRGHKAVVLSLIQQGAEIESKNRWGETPLSRAATKGHEAIVQVLIEQGAEIDARDVLGRTPISLANKEGHKAVVQLLSGRHTKDNTDPFSWAIGDRLEAVVRLTIELGLIDDNLKQRWEQNPLSWTAKEKQGAWMRLYMERDVYKHPKIGSEDIEE